MIPEKFIGCSGYYYEGWKEKFYPAEMPKNKWLEYYAEHFNTVEINSSFYRMPAERMMEGWYKKSPANFIITLKGNRFISHIKRLKVDDRLKDTLEVFISRARILKEKLGCILWQLPGSAKLNIERLESFCSLLNKDMHHVFEFRDVSWFNPLVYEVLRKNNFTFCIVSAPDYLPEVTEATSDIAYLRFHGKSDWYNYSYSDEELIQWKKRIEGLAVKRLFAYFNNDVNAHAVYNGLTFAKLFDQK